MSGRPDPREASRRALAEIVARAVDHKLCLDALGEKLDPCAASRSLLDRGARMAIEQALGDAIAEEIGGKPGRYALIRARKLLAGKLYPDKALGSIARFCGYTLWQLRLFEANEIQRAAALEAGLERFRSEVRLARRGEP